MSSPSATFHPPPTAPPTDHGAGGLSPEAAASAAARKIRIALAQQYNERVPRWYFVAMGGLILIFTIFHWVRVLYSRSLSKGPKQSAVMSFQVAVARSLRNRLVHQVPGFTSIGHLVLVVLYMAVNIILTVTFIDWSSLTGIGKRCGWMALTNMTFIIFLALKNTPLAFLTSYSYERLNGLHQIGGYTTVIFVSLHLTLLCKAFMLKHNPGILLEVEQINGMIAGCGMLIVLLTALFVRKHRYELFYVTHVVMFMLIVINIALHRPEFLEKSIYITIVAGTIWGIDRCLRGWKIMWYSFGNRATIMPLPHGGTRILLSRSPSRALPGNHCFLWLPKIRLIETHPFTIVSSTPKSIEFVVAAYDGFTNDLHKYALKIPGASLRASIDGPYGAIPNLAEVADKVVLVAGGSGASFTFGAALDIIKQLGTSAKTTVDFIWAVKEQEALSWFAKELNELQSSPLVAIHLYTTRSHASSPYKIRLDSDSPRHPPLSEIIDEGKSFEASGHKLDHDIEKHPAVRDSPIDATSTSPWDSTTSLSVTSGRPDVEGLIQGIVAGSSDEDRIAIAACGPDSLMSVVRKTAAGCIKVKGPSIELHCEQFGW